MTDVLPDYQGGAGRWIESQPVVVPEIRPARSFAAITPGTSALDPLPTALWVNQACDLEIEGADEESVTLTIPMAGPIPFAPTKVLSISTGTVLALYS